MQKISALILTLLILLPLSISAQGRRFLRYNCIAPTANNPSSPSGDKRGAPRMLPTIKTQWDSTRVYPIAVVLVQFNDKTFSSEAPQDRYNRMFNEEGYNEGVGPGCVAEYFRCQSGGLFKPQFDVYGPVTIDKGYKDNGSHGANSFVQATRLLADSLLQADSLNTDFSRYDWDNDGRAEAFIYVYAGYGGNESSNKVEGCIWPNTGTFSTVTLPTLQEEQPTITLRDYSASAELWSSDRSCGIGTICHEYTHSLGLPDIYPTSGSEYSVCDEWDLMDGGNFINDGWCPCNYSVHAKMLMGWLEPEELAEPADIDSLKPLADGGKAYIIRTESSNEFFLLENRQWNGWDLRTPGHGLLISHVDYDASLWSGNRVNTQADHHHYDLVHADNLSYTEWEEIFSKGNQYIGGHSRYLSGTPYPLLTDSIENRALTDESLPAATTFSGTELLGKPITAITENDDATISFLFMGGDPLGIRNLSPLTTHHSPLTYDLMGRPITSPSYRGLVIKQGKKYIIQ